MLRLLFLHFYARPNTLFERSTCFSLQILFQRNYASVVGFKAFLSVFFDDEDAVSGFFSFGFNLFLHVYLADVESVSVSASVASLTTRHAYD